MLPFLKFHILFVCGHIDPIKEPLILLIVLQAKRKLVTPQSPQVVKQIICSCGILPEAPLAVQNITQHCPTGRKRCEIVRD